MGKPGTVMARPRKATYQIAFVEIRSQAAALLRAVLRGQRQPARMTLKKEGGGGKSKKRKEVKNNKKKKKKKKRGGGEKPEGLMSRCNLQTIFRGDVCF